jgi:Rrf2 family nitric oxide-sensitive transcriptional repressor
MLSQTAEYALRAIVFLADHHGEANTTETIAETTKVPVGYLAKILQGLARAGLVLSQRGLHGGFTLLRSPNDLSMYDVMQAVDPITRITKCPLDLPDHGPNLCPLHRRLDNAMLAIETAFRKTTIAQLLAEPTGSRPLCNFPRLKPSNGKPR